MKTAVLEGSSSLSLPAGSYIYSIKHVPGGIAAISSDNSLRVFDPGTLQVLPSGIFDEVHDGVTALDTRHDENRIVFTAGREGTVRGWDMRTREKPLELSDRS